MSYVLRSIENKNFTFNLKVWNQKYLHQKSNFIGCKATK